MCQEKYGILSIFQFPRNFISSTTVMTLSCKHPPKIISMTTMVTVREIFDIEDPLSHFHFFSSHTS